MKTETELKLDRLYVLLKELETQNRTDDASDLRWAIFQLEQGLVCNGYEPLPRTSNVR